MGHRLFAEKADNCIALCVNSAHRGRWNCTSPSMERIWICRLSLCLRPPSHLAPISRWPLWERTIGNHWHARWDLQLARTVSFCGKVLIESWGSERISCPMDCCFRSICPAILLCLTICESDRFNGGHSLNRRLYSGSTLADIQPHERRYRCFPPTIG